MSLQKATLQTITKFALLLQISYIRLNKRTLDMYKQ